MRLRIILKICLLLLLLQVSKAQQTRAFKSWNPAEDSIYALEGQGWRTGLKNDYDRLPARAEKQVRDVVWHLSTNSAGMSLRFRTDADEIVVKYAVTGPMAMPHMPATGVSGVDLYVKQKDGQWLWSAGRYSFGDTVTYRFSGLRKQGGATGMFEYTLYLPLYNTVKWMRIEVPEESTFAPLPVRKDLPIVVYGTSIAQGGCASRPGLAWTSILGRKLDRPVINLAFSGNGRLERPVLDLMGELDARLYVLDCLPNMLKPRFSDDSLKKTIYNAVLALQRKRPGVPILLTEHDGYTDGDMVPSRKASYKAGNQTLHEAIDSLKNAGVTNVFLLSEEAIGQDVESMVDGTHPNDIGMMKYAVAYEQQIREILREPVGALTIQKPVEQYRDGFDWRKRHEEIIANTIKTNPKTIIFGNSIINYWGGVPQPEKVTARGEAAWQQYMLPLKIQNAGFGYDRIENVLWRIYHGELDHFNGDHIVLTIGTNNLAMNTDEEIIAGLAFLIQQIKQQKPHATILVGGILPRRNMLARVLALNPRIKKMAETNDCAFFDFSSKLMNGKALDDTLFMADGLHPNEKGYTVLGQCFSDLLN